MRLIRKGDMKMDKRELNMEELDQVAGGTWRTVNTGVPGLDAAVRSGHGKGYGQIGHISNGTQVNTVSDELIYDAASDRYWVEVEFNGGTGWMAASLVGLKRKP